MAHKKAGGSVKNGRDSESKRLGIKCFGNAVVQSGNILVRQRGTQYHRGDNVGMGKDHTLYAKVAGRVVFSQKGVRVSGGNRRFMLRRVISVKPMAEKTVSTPHE